MRRSFQPGFLTLSDRQSFPGLTPSWQTGTHRGEVVFSTGMTGYVESLTDPSYAGQILVFTYPLIGNYGVAGQASWESDRIHASGVVVGEVCRSDDHAQSKQSFLKWIKAQRLPLLTGVDTRSLTKHLRQHGTLMGKIGPRIVSSRASQVTPLVSISRPVVYNEQHKKQIILVDCGLKLSILRQLMTLPVRIKRVPAGYDYTKESFAGVVVSNGPGDPARYQATTALLRKVMRASRPVFGICLGSQIMALAAGAKTYKLLFGHRGHNQPCLHVADDKGFITSQNHGYAIASNSLPRTWRVTFRNLNDDSVEGIAHSKQPFFSVQFHPEARPGPTDTAWIFQKFSTLL